MGERILDQRKIDNYVHKYNIDKIFSLDMREYMQLFKFNKGEYICKVQEKLEYLFFLVEGKAKVYTLLENGKSLLLCYYKPFKVIGDVEVMHCNYADCSIQTIDETYCIGIPFEYIRSNLLEDYRFLRFMCDELIEKLTRISKYSSINLLYPLENRMASYIISNNEKDVFNENLTETAELLGTSYRHLLRILNILCSKKAIEKEKNHYKIIDVNILKELSGDLYE